MTDLDDIRRLTGPRQRHVIINLQAAEEMKERPIDGELEQLLDKTCDKRDRLQQATVYQSLRVQLEAAAKLAGKPEHDKVMKDYEEYILQQGTCKVNF